MCIHVGMYVLVEDCVYMHETLTTHAYLHIENSLIVSKLYLHRKTQDINFGLLCMCIGT